MLPLGLAFHRDIEGSAARSLASALEVLRAVLDIVDRPIDDPGAANWCRERGWDGYLLGLSEQQLRQSEERGLWSLLCDDRDAPAALRELAAAVEHATRLPRVLAAPWPLPPGALRGVSARKRGQLSALLAALSPLAERSSRLVDVGAGSGHLARLAAELFARPTVAWDRDARRTEAGNAWASRRAREVGELNLSFVVADACLTAPTLLDTDLLIGLHACGELGDRLTLAAAESGCNLTLVSCCLQKIGAPSRAALSAAGSELVLRRAALGLTNLSAGAEGVETSLDESLRAREVRLGLRKLLRARGLALAPGEEMRGVNRRRARAGLTTLAPGVCAARSLAPPTAGEIQRCERSAALDYALIRRLSLPRHLLARLVELCVILDRGAALEERGHAVRVATFCDRQVTPRNVALFASPKRERLPDASFD